MIICNNFLCIYNCEELCTLNHTAIDARGICQSYQLTPIVKEACEKYIDEKTKECEDMKPKYPVEYYLKKYDELHGTKKEDK